MLKPDTRTGTCIWCEREDQTLYFIVWCFNGQIFTDWVCSRCRRIHMTMTVNENED